MLSDLASPVTTAHHFLLVTNIKFKKICGCCLYPVPTINLLGSEQRSKMRRGKISLYFPGRPQLLLLLPFSRWNQRRTPSLSLSSPPARSLLMQERSLAPTLRMGSFLDLLCPDESVCFGFLNLKKPDLGEILQLSSTAQVSWYRSILK